MSNQEIVLRLAFVGDVALGNHPKTPGFGFYSRYREGIPQSLAKRVLPPGLSPDIFFGNLEFALANDEKHAGTDVCCLGSTSYIPFLLQAGFTVLNVASNHSWEHGAAVFWETVKLLQDSGIKVVGIPDDFDPEGFLRIKGKTVAFLGCSARPRQGFSEAPGYNEFDMVRFLERIREAQRNSDLVCVSIHWGEEFLTIPGPQEKEIARAMIEAGASVVVGHHPHVIREIENYREGIIAYSLGNFICDMSWNHLARESGCLTVEVIDSRILTRTFFPATIRRDYFPHYLNQKESLRFLDMQMKRQARLGESLCSVDYDRLAKKALIKHQWLTFGFLLRNIFRYRISTLWRILKHGIQGRLQQQKTVG